MEARAGQDFVLNETLTMSLREKRTTGRDHGVGVCVAGQLSHIMPSPYDSQPDHNAIALLAPIGLAFQTGPYTRKQTLARTC